ncbi:hypothetical protein UUU_25650 [Klebsiella pneumoniae subsp. pneumoniae DSM 30104 = JCM 1662 = NBRC 14940]|nr:hypothetical protein UUU_25650 [Klebsiella pneumoniae subsp. pneumoniae DSM 30104 = JCM 1662 = NBRC 14940]
MKLSECLKSLITPFFDFSPSIFIIMYILLLYCLFYGFWVSAHKYILTHI